MAAYHACWDLNYYGLIEVGIGVDPVWLTAQRSILTAFLLLAGASLELAHRNGINWRGFLKREAILVGAALAVSAGTWFLFQDYFAYFGVLHLIAFGSLLALPLTRAPSWVGALVAALVLVLPAAFSSDAFDARWLSWIGFFRETPETADLVPLFPWYGVMLVGMLGMRLLRQSPAITWQTPSRLVRGLGVLGRWSLVFYLLHQPILFGIITPIAEMQHNGEQQKLASFTQSCMASCATNQGAREGAGGLQFCTNYCHCALDMTVRDQLWDAPPESLKRMSALCTAMSE